MSNSFGNNIKITIFGQSHSEAVGVVMDGIPAGKKLDMPRIAAFLSRRAASGELSTARTETDEPHILSGLMNGVTCGAPLCAVFENANTKSKDYDALRLVPRPSHADYPAYVKYGGFADYRGGGAFSGRLTAPLCFAGAVCIQLLEQLGVFVGAHILQVGNAFDRAFDPLNVCREQLSALPADKLRVIDPNAAEKMREEILGAKADGDSVGGCVECCVLGVPVGVGEPMFDGLENRIAQAVFAIPAVKGIEFGAGFELCAKRGSQCNDEYTAREGKLQTLSNNCGGILGGLSSGMPLIFRAAFKPTPSIALPQRSVELDTMCENELQIKGRHDPCIVTRATPCVEAAAAIAVYDLILSARS